MDELNRDQMNQIYKFDPPPEKKRKGRKGLKIWLIVVACIVVFGAVIAFTTNALFSSPAATLPTEPYVGVLYVEGVIAQNNVDTWGRAIDYQHDFTIKSIDQLIKDKNNRGMIICVDSPGGGVYESDELYFKIKEYKNKTGRPVFSYMKSMAASGGYYISAPADMIYANRNCWTGSIGVTIGTLYDLSGLLEKYGVETVTITSGRNKSMGSIVDPLTDEQRKIFQSLVDEAYDQFVGIVAEGRNMDPEKVKELADGRIYTAKQALELGLVDVVCSYEDAISHMADNYALEGYILHDMRYRDNSFMGRLLGQFPLPQRAGSDVETILSMIKNDVAFPVSYLSEVLAKQ